VSVVDTVIDTKRKFRTVKNIAWSLILNSCSTDVLEEAGRSRISRQDKPFRTELGFDANRLRMEQSPVEDRLSKR
jgi:hypothetical protein